MVEGVGEQVRKEGVIKWQKEPWMVVGGPRRALKNAPACLRRDACREWYQGTSLMSLKH